MPNSSKANIYNDVTINTNSRKSNYRRRDIILSRNLRYDVTKYPLLLHTTYLNLIFK